MKKRIFVENDEKFVEKFNENLLLDESAKVKKYDKAIILPARKNPKKKALTGIYEGGVCDENFNFIAGLTRSKNAINLSCSEAYVVDKEEITYVDEEVIFGGVLFDHFGHIILESFSRLWYVVKYPQYKKKKIAYLFYNEVPNYAYRFFELLGIPKENILTIAKPMQFKRVIVPDETIYCHYKYKKEYELVYNAMRDAVTPKNVDKIYLTRTQLTDKVDVNEKYYEDFFAKRGYMVIAPEKYSVDEQIAYVSGAKEIVASIGTLSHLALFSHNKTKLIMINRSRNEVLKPQIIINQMRELDYYLFDGTLELLPTRQARGVYLFYPTTYFHDFLKNRKIPFTEEDLEVNREHLIYEYLMQYTINYQKFSCYNSIYDYDIFDLINCLSNTLYDKPLDILEYNTKDNGNLTKKELIKKYENLKKENKKLKKEIKNIRSSNSWRITKPLRAISKFLKK